MVPLLEVIGVSKRFTGTLALDQVDFEVRAGEIHALLGQNGAGKSTLIKILAGVYPADGGAIRWRGQAFAPGAEHRPIAFIHQELGLVDAMSVAENVALQTGYPRRRGLIDWRGARRAALAALAAMDSALDPSVRVVTLSAADRSIVAIARALAVKSDVLVLDEPTAALPAADVDRLLATLHRLRAGGIGLVYVTHRLDEVFRIADRVTVLRDGRCIATMAVGETSPQDLVLQIVGRGVAETVVAHPPPSESPLLAVEGLVAPLEADAGMVGPVSFSVAAGETLGLVGLRGAGHHAVGRAIFGALPVRSGRILLDGSDVRSVSSAAAMHRGIGFVSSHRAEESLAGNMSVQENLYLNPRARGTGVLQPIWRQRELLDSRHALARFSVRPPDPFRPIATLSGGNQQKVVVGRWMEARTRLLILEEPTIGVDVGSKAEIYRDMRDALERGVAVLLISSDFEEIEKVCHRALVFSRGTVVAELARPDISQARLTELAAGGGMRHAAA